MPEVLFTCGELATAAGGEWLQEPLSNTPVYSVVTDTRQECSGGLFIALVGDNFNAHEFLDNAVEAGADALCINWDYRSFVKPEWDIPVLMVDDTLRAYQSLAHYYKRRFAGLQTVAVTGSMGKTSAKEIIRSIMIADGGKLSVCATVANTNNQVGVPQNLFRLNSLHRYCVLEMGTNHFGEIEPLSCTAEPDIALITSIAPCHLEFLQDINGVAREKAQIFSGLSENGIAVIPHDCPEVEYLRKAAASFKIRSFGFSDEADVQAVYHGGNINGSSIELRFHENEENIKVEWPLSGAHQALNAAAAACVAVSLGVSLENIAKGLKNCELPGMRMKVCEINGVNWINDAYNASPESVKAALEWLSEFAEQPRLTIVLGDMLELGKHSHEQHKNTLSLAFEMFPEAEFVLVGEHYEAAVFELPMPLKITICSDSASAGEKISERLKKDDTIFLKGSRGIRLEKIMPEQ
jgi:UDP-N-acetylmuramoyl-tripeptide--D-alanyl-D-alanine ligase